MDLVERVRSIEQRFWQYVDRLGPDECWNWKLSLRRGYGQIRISSKPGERQKLGSHQVAYLLENGGKLPPAVRHTCDNSRCCNPSHLVKGTQQQNVVDRTLRGRNAVETNHHAKLTAQQVREIRAYPHVSQETLAREYGVSTSTISLIRLGKTWRNIS